MATKQTKPKANVLAGPWAAPAMPPEAAGLRLSLGPEPVRGLLALAHKAGRDPSEMLSEITTEAIGRAWGYSLGRALLERR